DFKSITLLEKEEDGQFVIACEELDNYDKNGKAGKKPVTLIDDEGNEIKCTLWGDYAQQFNDFLNSCDDHDRIVLVLQFAMMKFWDEVEEFRQRLFANQPSKQSKNTATKISTASKNSTKDNFVNRHPIRNIAELLDVEHGVQSVIVGTIITIQEDEGWWYLGCRACRGKVIKSTDYVDLESEMPKKPYWPNDWWCRKCNAWVALIKSQFRLQIRVQDETGTMSLSLFNDEVQAMVGRSAYQLCEKYVKRESDGSIPMEITNLIGNKYAFKVAIDDYNVKKLLHVFTVLCFSNDQEIITSVLACATSIKDNEATSSTVPAITSLDLESQTDENTTPNEKQKTNKRHAEGESGSESSTGKKKAVEIKVKKDALTYWQCWKW
ncbi:replication protein A 70 kDa DNA-binding subunit B, partial [Tanacetum coccineum]